MAQGVAGTAVGNAAAGLTGTAATANSLGQTGGAVGSAGSKGDSTCGLTGAYREGLIACAGKFSSAANNESLMHVLYANNGVQMVGHVDLTPSTYALWYGDPKSYHDWRLFIHYKNNADSSPYVTEGSCYWKKGFIYVKGNAKTLRNCPQSK